MLPHQNPPIHAAVRSRETEQSLTLQRYRSSVHKKEAEMKYLVIGNIVIEWNVVISLYVAETCSE